MRRSAGPGEDRPVCGSAGAATLRSTPGRPSALRLLCLPARGSSGRDEAAVIAFRLASPDVWSSLLCLWPVYRVPVTRRAGTPCSRDLGSPGLRAAATGAAAPSQPSTAPLPVVPAWPQSTVPPSVSPAAAPLPQSESGPWDSGCAPVAATPAARPAGVAGAAGRCATAARRHGSDAGGWPGSGAARRPAHGDARRPAAGGCLWRPAAFRPPDGPGDRGRRARGDRGRVRHLPEPSGQHRRKPADPEALGGERYGCTLGARIAGGRVFPTGVLSSAARTPGLRITGRAPPCGTDRRDIAPKPARPYCAVTCTRWLTASAGREAASVGRAIPVGHLHNARNRSTSPRFEARPTDARSAPPLGRPRRSTY